ncbi:hypothetical protein [Gymnodinialimonas hymeniacidonis]|uniref:hypothetical protein n=1 Tax=Gymnodinialimonas hymeniacidonis TaxID=3126508 RepID=UPI0034C6DBA6
MLRKLAIPAVLALVTGPAFAQSAAQCEQALIIGPQQADPVVMAACMPYFRSLAANASAPGTFATPQTGTSVTLSTSGTDQ